MPFKIKPPAMAVRLRDEPRDDAASPSGLIQIADVLEKVADAAQAGWWQVRVVTPGAMPREGFVKAENLVETEAEPIPVEIDKKAFFTQLGFAARTFGTNREYLYAVAFFESGGVKNVKSKSSEAFGPFQFMPETWKDLVGKFGNQDGVTEADIAVPSKQVLFAARYANASQQALTEKLKRVPTAVELYLAHLLGNAGASAALSPPTSRPIDAGLRENFSASFVDSVLVANRNLLTDGNRVRTTDEVLDEIARHLDKGLEEAAALAKELGPPITQTPNDQGDPPWLTVALAELAKNVLEDKTGSNPVIEDYLRAMTYSGAISDDVAWCAAFVTWCMANSPSDIVVAKNKKSAWVPDWLNWGYDVGRPIRGAVAIVSPLRDGAAGHIGIVTGETDKNIVLLGGNQRNKQGQESVCETQFSKLAAVSYRWLDWK